MDNPTRSPLLPDRHPIQDFFICDVADAIPWVLLSAKSVGSEGTFGKVTSIQRVNTTGGVAPKSGCSPATAGTPARISYTADYYFFTAK